MNTKRSGGNCDKLAMDVSNNSSHSVCRRIDLYYHQQQHPIAWNRARYNRMRIELDSERSSSSLCDELTATYGANKQLLSDDASTQLISQPPPDEELKHTFNDNSSKECRASISDASVNKENVNPSSGSDNDAKVDFANENSATSRALLPVKGCNQNLGDIISHDSDHPIVNMSLHLDNAHSNDVSDLLFQKDEQATLQVVNPMHPQSSNDSGSVQADSTPLLTVLLSSGVYEYIQASRQRDTLSLLNDLNISYVIVDGMDQSQKEKRDILFKISGIRGNYPQIFSTTNDGNTHRFLGGYDWLHSTNIEEIVGTTANLGGTTTKGKYTLGNSPSYSSSVIVSPVIMKTNKHLILLISNGVYDNVQASNQEYALTRLSELHVPCVIVDGMDPLQRDERDALFAISSIRGNYPQIFISTKVRNAERSFLGGYDWLRTSDVEDLKSLLLAEK